MAMAQNLKVEQDSPQEVQQKPFNKGEVDRDLEKVARQFMPGPDYVAWLGGIHDNLKPRSYLEVGLAKGRSLSAVGPHTLSVGVDPAFDITHSIVSPTRLFRMTSDTFFQAFKSEELFGQKVDLCFLDGLHHFEQTFRDLVHVARHTHEKSVVAIHSTISVHEIATLRNPVTDFWTGDVWKMVYLINEFFPNLEMWTIPTYPSGLTILKGFDGTSPEHSVWERRAEEIVEKPFIPLDAELRTLLNIRDTEPEEFFAWMMS